MLRHKTAQQICQHWHGGQWSALYQFSSSAEYSVINHLRYLQEIEENLHPEFWLKPGSLTAKDRNELTALKNYFLKTGKRHGITTEYIKHPVYGYEIPATEQAHGMNITRQKYPV